MWKRLSTLWMAVKGDLRRVWSALRDPRTPLWFKAGIGLVLLYLLSPIDLIPDVVPVFGVVDDLVLLPMAIRWLLNRLPAHIREQSAVD